ncbi:bacillithiol biosynthesis deacetylase BshB1 [Antarcticibacterium sp. 1MA-6-2]|uniref:bacillithiol biosynthesis deacetylase BshB1 n=1 Tax=Antarcticibacterium sp. 1MA-6-2 TaxID=2908210 RepID=UPI001F2E627B|nr:bacillithiol biosynthesis deacetylase BshB1 [Antarcticibacterium sp. 1MA-6-2]UJH92248.1 bacillithiol biosynthesis deacetylase BshB1 [Antarcticibacterium sp. 1MA-6-2]
MKLDILAIGAHPDDVELSCSGTLAKEVDRGKKIGILDLTRGEMGTRGTAETRKEEAAAAAEILRLSVRENLGFRDAFFVNDEAHQIEIIKMLRKYRPEIVLCNAVEDRHIDHGRSAKLVSDACFLSGLRRIETSINGEEQEAWRPKHVYHYIQWQNIEPDIVIDISGYMDVKLAAVKAYKTQFWNENSKEPATPISSDNFLDSITYRARDLGRLIGTDHAEGFTVERYAAVDSIFDLI